MRQISSNLIGGLLLAVAFAMPARGDTPPQGIAVPGTLNYVEGQVSVGAQVLDSKSVGSETLQGGQTITTGNGKAELLLTPGVFLRVGSFTSVKMISPNLTDTEIGVEEGDATVEVAEIHRQNDIRIDMDGATTQLVKNGFYDFDAAHNQLRVLDGEAIVEENGRQEKVKGGHELTLNSDSAKPQGFDKNTYESGDLYRWSSLRSAYLAEANVDAAPGYIAGVGYSPGWVGAGWYWDPWFSCYTFIPGDGIFYSPFGWGFYSPFFAFDAPFFFGDGHFHHHFDPDDRGRGHDHDGDRGGHYNPGVRGGGYQAGHGYSGPHAGSNGGRVGGAGFRGGAGGGGFHGGGMSGGGFHGGGGGGHGR
jgi:FecR-like protein